MCTYLISLFDRPRHDDKKLATSLFWKVCAQTWTLHKLARAFFVEPEIVRIAPGETAEGRYSCVSPLQLGQIEEQASVTPARGTVVCTVMPGFELDGFVYPCDVVVVPPM